MGVEGRLSSLVPVVSWVPQGTVFGPCQFLIHLMDISCKLSAGTSATSFEDDTRQQRGIVTEQDCEVLQQDLDQVCRWANDVGMVFNAGKFELHN